MKRKVEDKNILRLDNFLSEAQKITTVRAHYDTTVSQNLSSAKPQCRSIGSWEKALGISGWTSNYRSVDNLLTYLKTRKSGSEATRKSYCSILCRYCARFKVDPDNLVKMPKSRIEQMIETVIKELREKDRSKIH